MEANFQAMSRVELRAYILEHREDQDAFYAYMDKLAKEPVLGVHSLSDPEPLSEIITKVNRERHKS